MDLTPYLSFEGNCEEAFRLYEKCLGGKIVFMMTWGDSPMADQGPPDWGKKIMHATLTVGNAILTETALSYLGLGIQPPTPSWGNMLFNAQSAIFDSPWIAAFPGLMIMLSVLSINLIGEGIRDAIDPRVLVGKRRGGER